MAKVGPELKSTLVKIEDNLRRKENLLNQVEIENGKLISYDNAVEILSSTLETKFTQQNILGESIQLCKQAIDVSCDNF